MAGIFVVLSILLDKVVRQIENHCILLVKNEFSKKNILLYFFIYFILKFDVRKNASINSPYNLTKLFFFKLI